MSTEFPWIPEEWIDVVRAAKPPKGEQVVIQEAYLPYIPKEWNGILFVAEAQSLTKSNPYRDQLEGMESEDLLVRLNHDEIVRNGNNNIGVGPWNTGYPQFALKILSNEHAVNHMAVGNAVVWTHDTQNNVNPNDELIDRSKKIWKQLIDDTSFGERLKLVIASGSISHRVFWNLSDRTKDRILYLIHTSYLKRVQNIFSPQELLARFPEVKDALASKTPDHSKVFFACHVISRYNELPEGLRNEFEKLTRK